MRGFVNFGSGTAERKQRSCFSVFNATVCVDGKVCMVCISGTRLSHLLAICTFAHCVNKDILGVVNMQHNCVGNKCDNSGTKAVFEEREDTGRTVATVKHKNQHDVMLNTAQMRNAKYVQVMRIHPGSVRDEVRDRDVRYAVEREIATQTAKAKGGEAKGKSKATKSGAQAGSTGRQLPGIQHQRIHDISTDVRLG